MNVSTDNTLVKLRNDAIRHDEWATKKLWIYILSHLYFNGQGWLVATEQPPVYNSQRRIDIIVERYSSSGDATVFLLIEAKKGRATPADIVEVEEQAFSACYEFMLYNQQESIWAMTCYGPEARLWVCERDGSGMLEPFFPAEGGAGERSAYVDIKGSETRFTEAFKFIIANPIPPADAFGNIGLTTAGQAYEGKGKAKASSSSKTKASSSKGKASSSKGKASSSSKGKASSSSSAGASDSVWEWDETVQANRRWDAKLGTHVCWDVDQEAERYWDGSEWKWLS